jgi:hypothetical protein
VRDDLHRVPVPLVRRRRGRHGRSPPDTINHKIIPPRSANVTMPSSAARLVAVTVIVTARGCEGREREQQDDGRCPCADLDGPGARPRT